MNKNREIIPTMLVVLDGFGYNPRQEGNAVAAAHMPFWNNLISRYPTVLLHASGEHVGLLPGYIGGSEVGHLTLGAGRVIKSMLKRFHDAIDDGSFFQHHLLLKKLQQLKNQGGALHLLGLLSDGGVHSHECHLHALIKLAAAQGIKKIYIHPFLDGRDVLPTSAQTYLARLEQVCRQVGGGEIASVHGRFYAMDRDKNWDRTAVSYRCLCGQVDYKPAGDWRVVLEQSYAHDVTDEFVMPTLLIEDGVIKKGDGVLFFNFRPDRARQLAECFLNPKFDFFSPAGLTSTAGTLSFVVTTVLYKDEFKNFSCDVLFAREVVDHTLLDELTVQGVQRDGQPPKIFIIAETEKYAHVTYFFRGMVEKQLVNEERVLVPSVKIRSYAEHPQMSASLITQHLVYSLTKNPASFYLVNYANADMVGHSGDYKATVESCQVLDQQLAILYDAVVAQHNGTLFIVGDHGNAEEKINPETHEPLTAHTCNPVPFVMVNKQVMCSGGNTMANLPAPICGLAHVAPTILKQCGFKIPPGMEQKTVW